MARRTSGNSDEYAGTSSSDEPVIGNSEPIDPTTIDGSGGGTTGNSGDGEFDPTIHVGIDKRNADGSFTRKRGRKAGSGNGNSSSARTTQKTTNLKDAIDSLSKTLVVVHMGIANITATPELVIDADEGKILASATANLLEQFDLKPDPKIQAVIGLVMAAGTVYGPRAYMIRQRKLQEARERKVDGTAGIYNADGSAAGTTGFSVVN